MIMTSSKVHPPRSRTILHQTIFSVFVLALIAGCRSRSAVYTPDSSLLLPSPSTASQPTSAPATPSLQPPSLTPPYQTWIDPDLPEALQALIAELDGISSTDQRDSAQVLISTDSGDPLGNWLFIAGWKSGPAETIPFRQILLTETTQNALAHLFGPGDQDCLAIENESELAHSLWLHPNAIALEPFESVQPALTILKIDNQDLLSDNFDPNRYPLKLNLTFQAPDEIKLELSAQGPLTNFTSEKLSSIAMTGVTAMVRDTAVIMEEEGLTYPAGDVQGILNGADITHINNEVPFAKDCPPPTSSQNSLRFCSDDRYLKLLEAVGTDVVELSGDHFGDWGPDAMLHTLDLYQQENWIVYGGGRNLQSGLDPVFIDHHGNHFAFIGCNAKSFDRYATASETNPGASRCDFDWMSAKIQQLSSEGYLVIATMQHEEVDSYNPIALQLHDFRLLAEAGAVIVSGSQAHHPQAFEYTGSSFIHYGLGNLFFDQWYLATRVPEIHANKDKSFIDLHYFYDNKYIGTRLIPLQFIDNARPRPMTPDEKNKFLDQVYRYSLWEGDWVYLFPAEYFPEDN
ncbi:MAG: CapA family protein [Anaerolineales bacterium]